MRHFTLSPHRRPRWYVTIDGLIILSIAMNGSISLDGRTGMVPTPCTVRTWGTQAIDYFWVNLMHTMPHHTHVTYINVSCLSYEYVMSHI